MRFLPMLAIMLGMYNISYTQRSPVLIPWSESGLNTRMEFSGRYSWRVFQVIDNGAAIAFLSQTADEILVYRLDQPAAPQDRIAVPPLTEDFHYADGYFYAVTTDAVVQIERKGGRVARYWAYSRPEGVVWALHKVYVNGIDVFLLTADEKTWRLNDSGLSLIDERMWKTASGLDVRTEVLNLEQFSFEVKGSVRPIQKVVSIQTLGLPGGLASAIYIGTAGGRYYLDVETGDDIGKSDPRRFIVELDGTGSFVSKHEIPFMYYTAAHRQTDVAQNTVYYAMSAPEGVYVCTLAGGRFSLPALSKDRYHYNEHLPVMDQDEPINGQEKIGNNCVTRTQAYENAFQYLNMTWTATSVNWVQACTALNDGTKYRTPVWVSSNGAKTSVPYKWGGWTNWRDWKTLVAQGRKCGNYFTGNSVCTGTPNASSSDATIIGVDCSGFISRAWELSSKYGTSGLPGICNSLGSAISTTGFNALKVGDIINTSGHVRMCVYDNPTGSTSFIESSADNWNVRVGVYSMTALTGYTSYRYKHIQDARLRLTQAINISPTSVNQGCPLTVTYQIGNYGTESWSGRVQLMIIQSNGNEVMLQESGIITLSTNQTSSVYTFTSPNVSSPTGSTRLEVRVRNNVTCGYGLGYKVGSGSFANPRIFTIGNSCNTGTCSAPTGLSVSNITQTGCRLIWSAVSGASQYQVFRQTPTGYVLIGTASSNAVNITGLSPGTYYCYTVKAICNGNPSGYSLIRCLTTSTNGCGTPVTLSTSNTTRTSTSLSWSSVSGASYYRIFYWNGNSWVQIGGNFTGTSASITGLSPSSTYCFSVRAVCGITVGGLSQWRCVATPAFNSGEDVEYRSSGSGNEVSLSEKGEEIQDMTQLDVAPNLSLAVFPNPSPGITTVKVEGNHEGPVNMTVHDLTGRLIFERMLEMNGLLTYELKLEGVEAGIYLLKVSAGEDSRTERIVVIK